MCTAATYKTKDFYFGRTLDYEFSYGDDVTVTPRNYVFDFRHEGKLESHYAIVGMAHVADGYPLYYDAVNEKGQCGSVAQAREYLGRMNLVGTTFNEHFPAAQLHWLIADKEEAVTVECTASGLQVYDNPVGVLTNNPPFEMQMFMLNNYMALSPEQPQNTFSDKVGLKAYSRGMGALGLPGDLSSASRFARVAYTKLNSVSGDGEEESVSQFFHILGSVDQQRGCCKVAEGKYEITIYTSCCNATKGIYYYTTYDNHSINAVDLNREKLDGRELVRYPLDEKMKINYVN